MINQELCKIQLSETAAMEKAAYFSKEASYDSNKNELSFKVNHATGAAFRLVHDDIKVVAIIEGTEKTRTSTLHSIEEFGTKQESLDRAEMLGMIISDDLINKKDPIRENK